MFEVAFLAVEVLAQVPVGGVKQTQGRLRMQKAWPHIRVTAAKGQRVYWQMRVHARAVANAPAPPSGAGVQ
ncbi:hypothetical protein PFL02_08960 [Pseudomonas fluorescens]|nr:hypothetical protein PFL02_08960 [Pseudomonas fluorescens]